MCCTDIIGGFIKMQLDNILAKYTKGKKYMLKEDVKDYFHYIEDEPFYITPSFEDIKNNKISALNPKFMLFSAPGATGKSALAQYIAYKYNAIYWNLSKIKLGTNSFDGTILNAVSAPIYSDFIKDISTNNELLVIDALDEAEIVSGRKMISNFIMDINNSIPPCHIPSIFLLARAETAQFIASLCCDNGISILHYEIGFFQESSAKNFIAQSIIEKNKKPTSSDSECINKYYDVIKKNITKKEQESFLGYAPVLEAVAKHIKTCKNRAKMITELENQSNCTSIIIKIMKDLLKREREDKVLPAFRAKCMEQHPEFTDWDRLYSEEEQLVRITNYILFNDKKYSNYELDFLPPQLVNDYQEMLDMFLYQHPFIRNCVETNAEQNGINFTGPAFRDYALAKLLLTPLYEELAKTYYEEIQSMSYFPSQIFFDCYTMMNKGTLLANHISYVYDSYKAKSTAKERPYLECAELPGDSLTNSSYIAIFGMLSNKNVAKCDEIIMDMDIQDNKLQFEQLFNISVEAPSLCIEIGSSALDTRITNSHLICKKIIIKSKNVIIESYKPEGCLFATTENFEGETIIDVAHSQNLKVSIPNINSFYSLIKYKYDFENNNTCDIVQFIHALRSILIEFRTHRKDTLAKTADRIENVVVGNSKLKREVLNYMKNTGIIYSSAHLYKIDEDKMQKKGINFNALSRMDTAQLKSAYDDFTFWRSCI